MPLNVLASGLGRFSISRVTKKDMKYDIGDIVWVILTGEKVQIVAYLPGIKYRVATKDSGYRVFEEVELSDSLINSN